MNKTRTLITAAVIAALAPMTAAAQSMTLDYSAGGGLYMIQMDCERHAANFFVVRVTADRGNHPRLNRFFKDSKASWCQQKSTASYKSKHSVAAGVKYHRGHLIAANTVDNSPERVANSFFMTNVLPMTVQLNTGAWKRAEQMVECLRENEPVTVMGGPLWGGPHKNDYFVKSHGIETPSYFWRVTLTNRYAIGWIMPNSVEAKARMLPQYRVDLEEISKRIRSAPWAPYTIGGTPPAKWLSLPDSNCKKRHLS
ncbi:DNA/RNA non-specific endonuclease [Marinobacterium jannaschii]|uniref:DNA/RNA non-specific endonuclease n=1 Tax=Marinobacterium jannaschii TaxID=64970 RepID=UPI0004861A36|nr:DNA/RNA non-specific endonuclease [Marinobacterium jannaschii]